MKRRNNVDTMADIFRVARGSAKKINSIFIMATLLLALPLALMPSVCVASGDTYTFLLKWGSYGAGDDQFKYPYRVAVDPSGNVYVADTMNHRIQKFDSDGNFITKWGSYGSGDGQFNYPWDVAVDSSGNVYVADVYNHRIQKFSDPPDVVDPPVVSVTVDIDLDTLNLKSKGRWITCYIELPEGYDVADIDVSTVLLEGSIPAELHPTEVGDHDSDGIPDLMVKFDARAVIEYIRDVLGTTDDEVPLTVTGKVAGTPFQGTDTIRVISK